MANPEQLKIARSAEAQAMPRTALHAIATGMTYAAFQELVSGGPPAPVGQIDPAAIYESRRQATRKAPATGDSAEPAASPAAVSSAGEIDADAIYAARRKATTKGKS